MAFSTEKQEDRQRLVEDNQLTNSNLQDAKWVKPPAKRRAGQSVAHLILSFTSPKTANAIIRHGLLVKGKKVTTRRLQVEPKRCFRCQELTSRHSMDNCPKPNETCGTCGKQHRTATCTVTTTKERHCINCNKDGHAAWDRLCPDFQRKSAVLLARYPEELYRYFITNDPTTWEVLPSATSKSPTPPISTPSQPTFVTQNRPGPRPSLPPRGRPNRYDRQFDWNAAPTTSTNNIPLGQGSGSHAFTHPRHNAQHSTSRSSQQSLDDFNFRPPPTQLLSQRNDG